MSLTIKLEIIQHENFAPEHENDCKKSYVKKHGHCIWSISTNVFIFTLISFKQEQLIVGTVILSMFFIGTTEKLMIFFLDICSVNQNKESNRSWQLWARILRNINSFGSSNWLFYGKSNGNWNLWDLNRYFLFLNFNRNWWHNEFDCPKTILDVLQNLSHGWTNPMGTNEPTCSKYWFLAEKYQSGSFAAKHFFALQSAASLRRLYFRIYYCDNGRRSWETEICVYMTTNEHFIFSFDSLVITTLESAIMCNA